MPFAAFLGPLTGGGDSTSSSTAAGGPRKWSHYWRKGGPMLVAELSSEWSHAGGGRQISAIVAAQLFTYHLALARGVSIPTVRAVCVRSRGRSDRVLYVFSVGRLGKDGEAFYAAGPVAFRPFPLIRTNEEQLALGPPPSFGG